MRKLLSLLVLIPTIILSQFRSTLYDENQLSLALRGGLDFPAYGNHTPYIDYKYFLNAGISADFYFNDWLGLGLDFDFFKNKTQNVFPTENLFVQDIPINSNRLEENDINRTFLGGGPNFRWIINDNLALAFKLKGGISGIKGGKTMLIGNDINPLLLNYHNGYNAKNVWSAKATTELNWFFSEYVGLNFGLYYMQHFGVKDMEGNPTASYIPYTYSNNRNILDINASQTRNNALTHEIHSMGFFAGLIFRIPTSFPKSKHSLSVTAKDKYTGAVLPDVTVELYEKAKRIYVTRTNSKGVAVFKNLKPADYEIKGNLYNIDLSNNKVSKNEFSKDKNVQKEISITSDFFIVKGQVNICKTSNGLGGVVVVLKNLNNNTTQEFTTNALGRFYFKADKNTSYAIYGKKGNYFSQTSMVSSKNADRNNILFLNLNVCMEPTICGKQINLSNIHYDLDKFDIKDEAKPELNKLVQFLKDNPHISVELSSHTDSRASENYNLTLSQNRANAAVNYIVQQGIDKKRLVAVGYGESKLVNHCRDGVPCTEEQHQQNRRTEMKVICVK